tara:strand:+ start:843 stop:1115 length:273 start_codon:yes stop_codon:yes gene_type:complete
MMRITLNIIIVISITFSAFTVIYIKHLNRLINIQIEESDSDLANKINEHKVLLNKKSKIINKELFREKISRDLGMKLPSEEKIIYLNSVE